MRPASPRLSWSTRTGPAPTGPSSTSARTATSAKTAHGRPHDPKEPVKTEIKTPRPGPFHRQDPEHRAGAASPPGRRPAVRTSRLPGRLSPASAPASTKKQAPPETDRRSSTPMPETSVTTTRPPTRTGVAISAERLVKTYATHGPKAPPVQDRDGLSITVDRGTIFGLLGPNGAGKSTTIKILTTLARPDSGTAQIEGVDVLKHPDQVRRMIGVVAQRSGSDPMATGRENLILQGHLFGMSGPAVKARADELLERFDLADAASRLVKTYSGGMQRRRDVALGRVPRPEILFLDEPTTGLDPEARTAMWQEINRLAGHDGMTVLLTPHYMEEADRLADRLAIVDYCTVVAGGGPDEGKRALRREAGH